MPLCRRLALFMFCALAAAGRIEAAEPATEVADLALKACQPPLGGLCVFAGVTHSAGLARLAEGCGLQVQGLVGDRELAARMRHELQGHAAANRVSVAWHRTPHLPYLDDLLNLFVAEGWGQGALGGTTLAEVERVLCPGGVAIVGSDTKLDAAALLAEAGKLKLLKAEKLPRGGAWIKLTKLMNPDFGEWTHLFGGPELNRVTTDKVFAVPFKEIRWCGGPVWPVPYIRHAVYAGSRSFHLESHWVSPTVSQRILVARDAHNGCELWREKIVSGEGLCADEKRVYCVDDKELVGRDAATGKLVQRYGPIALIHPALVVTSLDDCLLIGGTAVDKETGKVRWSRKASIPAAGSGGMVFVFDGQSVEAVNLADGKTVWKAAHSELAKPPKAYKCVLFCKAETVYLDRHALEAPKIVLHALERSSGALRWSRPHDNGSIIPYADAVYLLSAANVKGNPGPRLTEWDIKTGKDVRVLEPATFTGARCWSATATERYITSLEESIYFDRKDFKPLVTGRGIRSSCNVGAAFAYGLMYDLPHDCNCGTVLRGVSAVSGGSNMPKGTVAPAGFQISPAPAPTEAGPGDWPVYRGNPARAANSTAELPAELTQRWAVLAGTSALTQATGAGGRVFVSEPETHRVVALDLASGKQLWVFAAEGRVSVAPTLHKGLCLFGDHAGWVYGLDAASGRLVWQFQAAPEQRYMCAFGQPESSWPVRGGVLVVGDTACFAAGRTGLTDGGLHVYGVDPATGQQRWARNFTRQMPNDLLVSNGADLFLERVSINPKDGSDAKPRKGDEALHSRGYEQGASNALLDLLSSADPGETWIRRSNPGTSRGAGQTVAFDAERTVFSVRVVTTPNNRLAGAELRCAGSAAWTNKTTAQQMLGMVLAGPRVYCAGIPEFRDSADKPALWVLAAADGKELQKLPLEHTPAIDGVSTVGGKLLVTTADGRVLCFEGK